MAESGPKLCECGCGQPVSAKYSWRSPRFIRGHISKLRHPSLKHGSAGKKRTPTYRSWLNMRGRCKNPKDPFWPNYGGRGIAVCKDWDDFATFLADMGERPQGATLDRVDNDKSYGPENCRWATATEQANNRSDNTYLSKDGTRRTIAQWSARTGLPGPTIRARLKRGWSVERALTAPLQSKYSHKKN